ncbi:MAG: hypothetical protein ACREI7_01785, partial [Myxococcota bacterium]
ILVPVVLGFARRRARSAPAFLLGLAASCGTAVAFSLHIAGHPLGAYARLNSRMTVGQLGEVGKQLLGVLGSPSRGLLWFFPAAILAAISAFAAWRRLEGRQRLATIASALTIAAFCLLTASFRNWWGGYSLGPRLLAEIGLPAFLLVAIAARAGRTIVRSALAILLLLQSLVHFRLYSSDLAIAWNGVVQVDRGGERLMSVRDGLLAAAFVPGWRYEPPAVPYFRSAAGLPGGGAWRAVELAAAANADYGELRAHVSAYDSWHLHLGRLARELPASKRVSPFTFLPPGRPNMIQLCSDQSKDLPLPADGRLRRLAMVSSWRGARDPAHPVGHIALLGEGGHDEHVPLRLGREVFDPATEYAPPAERIIAGEWSDFDELVTSTFVPRRRAAYRRVRLIGPSPGDVGCLHVIAVSVQLLPAAETGTAPMASAPRNRSARVHEEPSN